MCRASPSRPAGERDAALEGLRGLAALVVFYQHLMLASVGGWSPSPAWTWLVSGPAAVMVFFVLSGYVIGLAYPEREEVSPGSAGVSPASGHDVAQYLRRRALRLVPINAIAVLLGCAVADTLDGATVAANLAFLQNFADYAGHWVLVLPSNPNLWSLNYEVVFYLGFALLWRTHLPLAPAFIGAAIVGSVSWFGRMPPVFVACYAFGALFWLAGLALAWRSVRCVDARGNWPAALLLAALTWKLQGAAGILLALNPAPPRFAGPAVKLYQLDFLPVCVWLVAAVAGREFRGFPALRVAAALIPLFGFGLRLADATSNQSETLALLGLYALALGLARWRPSLAVFRWCAPLGLISYALYATARPIEIAVFRAGQVLPPSGASFAWCALSTTLTAFALAWYLERRLQPALRRACFPQRPTRACSRAE